MAASGARFMRESVWGAGRPHARAATITTSHFHSLASFAKRFTKNKKNSKSLSTSLTNDVPSFGLSDFHVTRRISTPSFTWLLALAFHPDHFVGRVKKLPTLSGNILDGIWSHPNQKHNLLLKDNLSLSLPSDTSTTCYGTFGCIWTRKRDVIRMYWYDTRRRTVSTSRMMRLLSSK